MNIVIMAGGGGTRLWPLSREKTPKQFIDLGSGKTLIEEAARRAQALTDNENIYIATREDYHSQIQKLLPNVLEDHIFFEPEKRDTTAAFASVALRLKHLGQGGVPTIFMWADHIFTNENEFLADLRRIPELLENNPDHIVIVGHNPITPETGLGYMEVGEKLSGHEDVYRLKGFKEKPNEETAKKFISAGNYYWNLGYFSMKPDYLLDEMSKQSPELQKPIATFEQALKSDQPEEIEKAFSLFPKLALEYTLIEKTSRILAITGDYGWSDVGYWATVQEIFGKKGDHAPSGHHIHVGSHGCYIYNATDKAVTLIGQKDTIVVVTDDAILVTDKSESHKIKEVVAQLQEEKKESLL